eukprot:Seg2356.2 transcript_id=Seg2356.2/GoldUCD/mRNA.D3Y31 product="L-threonine dehydratase catabolic TdcB" protein_id=Seg2356.2/GoldUCD/D3Y31
MFRWFRNCCPKDRTISYWTQVWQSIARNPEPYRRCFVQLKGKMDFGERHFATEVDLAQRRIKDHIRKTPLEYSLWLSHSSNSKVYIKLEHEQITNSFKLRGATNKIRKLCEDRNETKKVVTASTGNHGLACARCIKNTGIECIIFVGEATNPSKIRGLERSGAVIRRHGIDCLETEMYAKEFAKNTGALYISPYNDPDIIAGQGTIGIEILEDLPDVDAVFVSVGGGGLISGIATYLKYKKPNVKVIGCQPLNSPVLCKSIEAGEILDMESLETLSDGTAGGVEKGAITFDMCKDIVDEWVLVTEDEISLAVYDMLQEHCKVVEGASGVAIASFLKTKDRYKDQNVVVVSCGANISIDKLRFVIDKHHEK